MQKSVLKVARKTATVGNRTVIVTGRLLRIALVKSEAWLETEAVNDPSTFISELAQTPLRPDILTFAQRVPDVSPKWKYPMEWDNVAVIPLAGGFKDWWENRLPQEARKNARRAAKRGVTTRLVRLTDDVVRGIMEINNESLMVQGRPSRHYGKDFDTVKRDYSSFPDRSDYIAAYCGEEFIGLVWLVRMGRVVALSQLSTKIKYFDKRPANALIARTVEFCCEQGFQYLTYGKYLYGKNTESSLMEFKRRIGFEQMAVPRYYVPLTLTGRLALRVNLHHGIKNILPPRLVLALVKLRSRYYASRHRQATGTGSLASPKSSAAEQSA